MTFRTEMGLYYYYFKVGSPLHNFLTALTQVLVTADSVGEGVQQLYRNNLTEFPLTINTLKRFNLYPSWLPACCTGASTRWGCSLSSAGL